MSRPVSPSSGRLRVQHGAAAQRRAAPSSLHAHHRPVDSPYALDLQPRGKLYTVTLSADEVKCG